MTALEQLAALRAIMGELAEIDSEGTLTPLAFLSIISLFLTGQNTEEPEK
jgi:hypothetical protein